MKNIIITEEQKNKIFNTSELENWDAFLAQYDKLPQKKEDDDEMDSDEYDAKEFLDDKISEIMSIIFDMQKYLENNHYVIEHPEIFKKYFENTEKINNQVKYFFIENDENNIK